MPNWEMEIWGPGYKQGTACMRLQHAVVAGSRVAVSSRRFPSHISDWAGRFGSHCSGVLTCMWAEKRQLHTRFTKLDSVWCGLWGPA